MAGWTDGSVGGWTGEWVDLILGPDKSPLGLPAAPHGGLCVHEGRARGCGPSGAATGSSLSLSKPEGPQPQRSPLHIRAWRHTATESHVACGQPTPRSLATLWFFLKLFNLTETAQ